jgi:hypothetical protein
LNIARGVAGDFPHGVGRWFMHIRDLACHGTVAIFWLAMC